MVANGGVVGDDEVFVVILNDSVSVGCDANLIRMAAACAKNRAEEGEEATTTLSQRRR